MGRRQPFAVEIAGSAVSGALHWPPEHPEDDQAAVVLLCHGLPTADERTDALFARITGSLTEAGLAVAEYSARRANLPDGPNHQRLAVEMIDDASAVFRWLVLRDELDLTRVGVLGFSLGAIVAAGLAQRTDQIARLCLLAPVTAEGVLSGADRTGEDEYIRSLGADDAVEGFLTDLDTLDSAQSAAAHDRPTLILHGAADRSAPPELSFAYAGAIELAGRDVQHTLVAHADHFFAADPSRTACVAQMSAFFAAMNDGSDRKNRS